MDSVLPEGSWFVLYSVGEDNLLDLWVYCDDIEHLRSLLAPYFVIVWFLYHRSIIPSLSKVFLTRGDFLLGRITDEALFEKINNTSGFSPFYHVAIDCPGVSFSPDNIKLSRRYSQRAIDCLSQFPRVEFSVATPGYKLPTRSINLFVCFKSGIECSSARGFFTHCFDGVFKNIKVVSFVSFDDFRNRSRGFLYEFGDDISISFGLDPQDLYPAIGVKYHTLSLYYRDLLKGLIEEEWKNKSKK